LAHSRVVGHPPASAAGWLSASAYRFSLRGDTEVKNLYRLANTVGLSGFRPVADGSARVDVSVSGVWQGFAAPEIVGTAQLRSVRTGMRGLNPPIEIASIILKVDPDRFVRNSPPRSATRTGVAQ
jgi:hypothetical protein